MSLLGMKQMAYTVRFCEEQDGSELLRVGPVVDEVLTERCHFIRTSPFGSASHQPETVPL